MADEIDPDDLLCYADPDNDDDLKQAAADANGDQPSEQPGVNFDAVQKANNMALGFYEKGKEAQTTGKDWAVLFGMGKFFGQVADEILKDAGVFDAKEDQARAWSYARHAALEAYAHTKADVKGLSDKNLINVAHEITRKTVQECPCRRAILQAIKEEMQNRQHPKSMRMKVEAPSQLTKPSRPGALDGSDAAGGDVDNDLAWLQFYIKTRKYATGLAWEDLWSQFWSHLDAVQEDAARSDRAAMLQYKCYANELLAHYRNSGS
jgi:hypothetical protein